MIYQIYRITSWPGQDFVRRSEAFSLYGVVAVKVQPQKSAVRHNLLELGGLLAKFPHQIRVTVPAVSNFQKIIIAVFLFFEIEAALDLDLQNRAGLAWKNDQNKKLRN